MLNWLRNLIQKIDISVVRFVRKPSDEEYCATVHQGRLSISKGCVLYMLGECQEIINTAFGVGHNDSIR